MAATLATQTRLAKAARRCEEASPDAGHSRSAGVQEDVLRGVLVVMSNGMRSMCIGGELERARRQVSDCQRRRTVLRDANVSSEYSGGGHSQHTNRKKTHHTESEIPPHKTFQYHARHPRCHDDDSAHNTKH